MRLALGFLLLTAVSGTGLADGVPVKVPSLAINRQTGQFLPRMGGGLFMGTPPHSGHFSMFKDSGSLLIGTDIGFGESAPVAPTSETIILFTGEALERLGSTADTSPPLELLRDTSSAARIIRSPIIEVVNADRVPIVALRSKYIYRAEQFARADGCAAPVAKMNFAVIGSESFETFAVACGTDAPISIRCDSGQCRAM